MSDVLPITPFPSLFETIPIEVFETILKTLDIRALLRLLLTCKRLRAIPLTPETLIEPVSLRRHQTRDSISIHPQIRPKRSKNCIQGNAKISRDDVDIV